MTDLPGILEMSPDKGPSNNDRLVQDHPRPLPPDNGQMKTDLQICVVVSIFPGGAGLDDSSALCPCDTA